MLLEAHHYGALHHAQQARLGAKMRFTGPEEIINLTSPLWSEYFMPILVLILESGLSRMPCQSGQTIDLKSQTDLQTTVCKLVNKRASSG